jgi:aminoglycoside phosphotransferase (APT) family kinase protein
MTLPDLPIAIAFTAEIYAWKGGQVLKLFKQGISQSTAEYEANLAGAVHAAGLPVPAVGEIIELDGRFGLEYERVEGVSMMDVVFRRPWYYQRLAYQLADLQAEMHQLSVPGLPSQCDTLEGKIRNAKPLPEKVRHAALDALGALPKQGKLCHGDFHPGNILLTQHGAVIIDWIDASSGSPLMDVARSTLLFGGGLLPPDAARKGLVWLIRRLFYRAYLDRYCQLHTLDKKVLSRWLPVAAAARLSENIPRDEWRLLSIAHKLLQVA